MTYEEALTLKVGDELFAPEEGGSNWTIEAITKMPHFGTLSFRLKIKSELRFDGTGLLAVSAGILRESQFHRVDIVA